MPTPIFPNNIAGLGWPVVKAPFGQTRIRRALSGREERVADYVPIPLPNTISLATLAPLWQFELTFNFLRGAAGSTRPTDPSQSRGPYTGGGWQEANALLGFIALVRGPFYAFFFDDPTDDSVVAQPLGVADGVTENFQLVRTFADPTGITSGFVEPITAPRSVTRVALVDASGHATPAAGYSVDKTIGLLTFASLPAAGLVVVADFTYWFRCRFTDDVPANAEEFMYLLHEVKSLKFVSALGDKTGAPV